jgi:hypothetical protein
LTKESALRVMSLIYVVSTKSGKGLGSKTVVISSIIFYSPFFTHLSPAIGATLIFTGINVPPALSAVRTRDIERLTALGTTLELAPRRCPALRTLE